MCALLANFRADVRVASRSGVTALGFAEACGHADVVEVLRGLLAEALVRATRPSN